MAKVLVFVPSKSFTAQVDACSELARTTPHLRFEAGVEYEVRAPGDGSRGGSVVASHAAAMRWQASGLGELKLVDEDEPEPPPVHTPKSEDVHTPKAVEAAPAVPVQDAAPPSEVTAEPGATQMPADVQEQPVQTPETPATQAPAAPARAAGKGKAAPSKRGTQTKKG